MRASDILARMFARLLISEHMQETGLRMTKSIRRVVFKQSTRLVAMTRCFDRGQEELDEGDSRACSRSSHRCRPSRHTRNSY